LKVEGDQDDHSAPKGMQSPSEALVETVLPQCTGDVVSAEPIQRQSLSKLVPKLLRVLIGREGAAAAAGCDARREASQWGGEAPPPMPAARLADGARAARSDLRCGVSASTDMLGVREGPRPGPSSTLGGPECLAVLAFERLGDPAAGREVTEPCMSKMEGEEALLEDKRPCMSKVLGELPSTPRPE